MYLYNREEGREDIFMFGALGQCDGAFGGDRFQGRLVRCGMVSDFSFFLCVWIRKVGTGGCVSFSPEPTRFQLLPVHTLLL